MKYKLYHLTHYRLHECSLPRNIFDTLTEAEQYLNNIKDSIDVGEIIVLPYYRG